MPAARCPHCSIILLDHEARGTTCPGCNGRLGNNAVTPAPASLRAGSSAPWLGLVACGGILVFGLVALVGYLAWPRPKVLEPDAYQPVAVKPKPKPNPPVTLPFPHIEAASDSLLDPPLMEFLDAPGDDERELLPPPRTEPVAAAPAKPAREIIDGENVVLDRPDGEVNVAEVNGDDRANISGKVKTLRLEGLNGEAVVDASKLQAERIIVGAINGRTKLVLRGTNIEFTKAINGDCEVIVEAPAGKVVFAKAAEVLGSCRVRIAAKEVDLQGRLGGGARLAVTLSSGGALAVRHANEGAQLEYRKASRKDPAVKIAEGKVEGGARVLEVD